jgi:hypothetical protein
MAHEEWEGWPEKPETFGDGARRGRGGVQQREREQERAGGSDGQWEADSVRESGRKRLRGHQDGGPVSGGSAAVQDAGIDAQSILHHLSAGSAGVAAPAGVQTASDAGAGAGGVTPVDALLEQLRRLQEQKRTFQVGDAPAMEGAEHGGTVDAAGHPVLRGSRDVTLFMWGLPPRTHAAAIRDVLNNVG